MRNLNLDQLAALREVVRLGGFTAAAGRLGLTQPAVSQQVRELEGRLGVPLVERIGKRAHPTEAGRALLAHAERLFAEAEAALDTVRRHREGGAGRVRVGTGATACIHVLPGALRRLTAARPGIEIVVRTGNSREMIQGVLENALDAALVTGPVPAEPRLLARPVREDPFVAVLPPGAPAGPPLAPADLVAGPLILYERGAGTSSLVEQWFAAAGPVPAPAMELGSTEVICRLVGAGLGRSVLPTSSVAASAASGEVATRPLVPPLARTLVLVRRRDKPVDPALAALWTELERLGDSRSWPPR